MADVVANTDTSLSRVPSSNSGHTITVEVTPSVAFNTAPRGKPITTTRNHDKKVIILIVLTHRLIPAVFQCYVVEAKVKYCRRFYKP